MLALVLNGDKRATCSSFAYFENRNLDLPKEGEYCIITDWDGVPHCVVKTTSITVLPFKEMTFEICKREGEDDNLQSWQRKHIQFFTQEGKIEGNEFSFDMSVVFEDFEVVYTK